MPNYITGCILAVPTDKKATYKKHAKIAAELLKEYGALQSVECWGADVPEGRTKTSTSFRRAVRQTEDETVVFSWIVWRSRGDWLKAKKLMAKDKRWEAMGPMVFDTKRMVFGTFAEILNIT